jgi:hypothetical protein
MMFFPTEDFRLVKYSILTEEHKALVNENVVNQDGVDALLDHILQDSCVQSMFDMSNTPQGIEFWAEKVVIGSYLVNLAPVRENDIIVVRGGVYPAFDKSTPDFHCKVLSRGIIEILDANDVVDASIGRLHNLSTLSRDRYTILERETTQEDVRYAMRTVLDAAFGDDFELPSVEIKFSDLSPEHQEMVKEESIRQIGEDFFNQMSKLDRAADGMFCFKNSVKGPEFWGDLFVGYYEKKGGFNGF